MTCLFALKAVYRYARKHVGNETPQQKGRPPLRKDAPSIAMSLAEQPAPPYSASAAGLSWPDSARAFRRTIMTSSTSGTKAVRLSGTVKCVRM